MPLDLPTLRLIYVRRVVVTLAQILGLDRSMRFARWLARGVFDLNTPARQRVEQNLALAYPERLSADDRERLARAVLENVAAFWVEVFFGPRKLRATGWRRFVAFEDEGPVRALADSDRGALLVTGYFGNFAVAAYALGQVLKPLHVVIDPVEHPVLKAWQDEYYDQPNIEILPRQRARGRLADLLAAGEKVLLVGEHARPHGRAIEVPYLGRRLPCYPTVGLLSRWCDVPVYVTTARRTPQPYQFTVSLAQVADPRDLAADPDPTKAITREYIQRLETIVHTYPDQYLWTRSWPEKRCQDEFLDAASGDD